MRIDVANIINDLVGAYSLHDRMPVKLDALEGVFRVRFAPLRLHGLAGTCLPSSALPPTEDDPALIVIDDSLSEMSVRLVYAHEIGHAIHGHPGELAWQGMDSWFQDKAERQAWEVAAMLLMPWGRIHGDVQEVSAMTYLPEHLVRLAWTMPIT